MNVQFINSCILRTCEIYNADPLGQSKFVKVNIYLHGGNLLHDFFTRYCFLLVLHLFKNILDTDSGETLVSEIVMHDKDKTSA